MFGKWEVRELKLFSKLISRLFPPESIKELERLYIVYLQYIQSYQSHLSLAITVTVISASEDSGLNNSQYHCCCLCLIYRTNIDIQNREISGTKRLKDQCTKRRSTK